MKKGLIRIISCLMIVIMMLVSAPIGCFVDLGFGMGAIAAEKFTEGYYTYEVNDDATATITDVSYISGNIVIPDSLGGYTVTHIGDRAFIKCDNLESVTIPDSVTTIGKVAFGFCSGMKTVTIGKGTTAISYDAFYCCDGLKSIEVNESNRNYSSADGVLFNKDKTELIQYPAGNERTAYTIPDSVKAIYDDAFYKCRSLVSVTIQDGVETIGDRVFADCSNLESVTISNSVITIGEFVFEDCISIENLTIGNGVISIGDGAFLRLYSLKYVYYAGTQDQWEKIEIGLYNNYLTNAIIHFCDHNTITYDAIEASCIEDGYTEGVFCEDCRRWISGHETVKAHHIDNGINTVVYPATEATCTEDGYTEGAFCKDCEIWISGHNVITATGHSDSDGDGICDVCNENLSDILPNETKTIEVFGGQITYLKFIPIASGRYTFTSLSDDNTYGYLCDVNMNELKYDDDSGDRRNFSITYDLTAGVTYYWGARYYSRSQSGSFDVRLTCDEVFCDHIHTVEHSAIEPTCTEYGYSEGIFCEDCQTWIYGHEVITKKHHTDEDKNGFCDICAGRFTSIIDEGKCGDNVYWTLDSEGTIVINGEGAMYDYYYLGNESPFSFKQSIKKVVIEDGVTAIGDCAFAFCDNLESITISNSVLSINMFAFYGCGGLTDITIPESVINIDRRMFEHCYSIKSINVDANNKNYSSLDGVLFNKDKTELIKYPNGAERTAYAIPDGIETIGYAAFVFAELRNVTFPDSVTVIDDYAFNWCDNLTSVTIPESVIAIGKMAFGYEYMFSGEMGWMEKIENFKIYGYSGTEAERYADKNEFIFISLDPQHTHSYTSKITKAATCGTSGVKTYTCTVCGDTKTETISKTNNHTWDNGVVTKEPTVKANGIKTYTCTVCKTTKTESIPKLTESVIDTSTVKEKDGSVYSAPNLTAADVLNAAGLGAKILNADGTELKSAEKVGSGMVLQKADGTKETIIVKGDNTGDGEITASDARYALRTAVSLEKPNDWQKNASLVDSSKAVITAADARLILRAAVNLEALKLY